MSILKLAINIRAKQNKQKGKAKQKWNVGKEMGR